MAPTSLSDGLYPYLLPMGSGSPFQLEPGPSLLLELHHRSTGVQPSNSHACAWVWPPQIWAPTHGWLPSLISHFPCCYGPARVSAVSDPGHHHWTWPWPVDWLPSLLSDLPCHRKLTLSAIITGPALLQLPGHCGTEPWLVTPRSWLVRPYNHTWPLGCPSMKEQWALCDHWQYRRNTYNICLEDTINRDKPRWPETWRTVTHLVLWVAYISVADPLDSLIMEQKMMNAPFDLTSVTNHACHFRFWSVPDTLFVYIRASGWSAASLSPFYLSSLKLFNKIFLFLFQLSIKKWQVLTGTQHWNYLSCSERMLRVSLKNS